MLQTTLFCCVRMSYTCLVTFMINNHEFQVLLHNNTPKIAIWGWKLDSKWVNYVFIGRDISESTWNLKVLKSVKQAFFYCYWQHKFIACCWIIAVCLHYSCLKYDSHLRNLFFHSFLERNEKKWLEKKFHFGLTPCVHAHIP